MSHSVSFFDSCNFGLLMRKLLSSICFQDGETRSLNSALKARSVSVTNMLEKLVMEKELKFVAFAEEVQYKSAYSIFVCLFKYRFC